MTIVGDQPSLMLEPMSADQHLIVQSHVGEVSFELASAEVRKIPSNAFEVAWREKVGEIPELNSLVFESSLISLGSSIRAELTADTPEGLEEASLRFRGRLNGIEGVSNIDDDQDLGKREVRLEMLPESRSLGLTFEDMALQVRNAFFGAEALRVQRGRDDIRVMVRLPQEERDTPADLKGLLIRTPSREEIPLSEVAEVRFGSVPGNIHRRDRRRVITVSADVNEEKNSLDAVIDQIGWDIIPAIRAEIPGFRVNFEGEQRQQEETLSALTRGFVIALFVMYALLAIPFRSYIQPFIIMAVVPFGFLGALLGHIMMGISLSMLSLFGIVALSGIVINDSLVLIHYINERVRAGVPMEEAIWEGGRARFRPIFLTSVTTFLGVLPLILEQSTQAQFLIPMAVSLGIGVLFATILLMMLVPALMMLHYRLDCWLRPGNYAPSSS